MGNDGILEDTGRIRNRILLMPFLQNDTQTPAKGASPLDSPVINRLAGC